MSAAPAAAAAAASASSSSHAELDPQKMIDLLLSNNSKYNQGFDTLDLAAELKVPHQTVVGAAKALENEQYITCDIRDTKRWDLTEEGLMIAAKGAPEYNLAQWMLSAHAGGPVPRAAIDAHFTEAIATLAINNGMKEKLFKIIKGDAGAVSYQTTDAAKDFKDAVQSALQKALSGSADQPLSKAEEDAVKRRKLGAQVSVKHFFVKKAEAFRPKWNKAVAELTKEMLQDGSWKDTTFKKFNLVATDGKAPEGGQLHPLLKVRQEFREIFLELGFQEMETSAWVESSFWNFDTLFVPQNHPARDAQDTFFVSKPERSQDPDADYLDKTHRAHEAGYCGAWNVDESRRNVLRTHTTAVSSAVLYELAQQAKRNKENPGAFTPGRYFSIDRVFRNEEMDKTHLCEFHQVEGFIVDKNLSLANMMHTLHEFFKRIGIEQIRFKPAYNPYTEPSMEIFGYHAGMDRWMEVGNSGVFRPEMLQPMGFGPDVTAIAWGLSLERPTMIKYGIKNIHELFGHNVNIKFIKRAAIARF